MCPYTLVHNKMLASTMQHSTHNHTPRPHDHHHTHNRCVRQPARAADQRTTPHQQVSPQDPTACRTHLMNPQTHPQQAHPRKGQCSTQPHPTTTPEGTATRAWNRERRTNPLPPRRATDQAGQPHHTVRLLRKEVIQPHLPVRLPCYDFVPIASPTFDNSLPQAG
jgi:hypothetical protein